MQIRRQSRKYLLVRYARFFAHNGLVYLGLLVAVCVAPNWWNILLFIAYDLALLVIFLSYFTNTYQLTETTLRLQTGTLFLTTFELQKADLAQTVSNFRIEQNIFQKLCGTKGLQLYLKSSTSEDALELYALSPEALAELSTFLAAYQMRSDKEAPRLKEIPIAQTKLSTLLKTGLFSTRYLVYLVFILQLGTNFPKLQAFLVSWWVWLLLLSGAVIWHLSTQYLNFAKFKLFETETTFNIQNRLLLTEDNVIQKKALVGLELTADLNRRLFSYVGLQAILTNEDNDQTQNKTKNFLFPFLPKEKLPAILTAYFPQIPSGLLTQKPVRPKRLPQMLYLLSRGLILGLLYFVARFFFADLLVLGGLVLLVLLFWEPLVTPLTTTFTSSQNYLLFTSGLLNKRMYILPQEMVTSVTIKNYFGLFQKTTLTFATTNGKVISFLGLGI